jgi:hypothetical protein
LAIEASLGLLAASMAVSDIEKKAEMPNRIKKAGIKTVKGMGVGVADFVW